jgi:hypothetical protein
MNKFLLSLALCTSCALVNYANAGTILLTEMDFQLNGGTDVYAQMKANLESDGHTVDIVDVKTGGNLAAALAANTYDQIFIWDLTSTLYLNAADTAAVASFWNTSMGLVVDTRSYGYFFQGADPSEVALLQNVASALDLSGGGLWIGSDHDPAWTNNANAVLASIGINPITGSFSDPVNFADPSSFLLQNVTPTDLWAANQSVGQAPVGLQPNGVDMFIHFGHTRADGSILPYISASFDLQGPVDPNPIPLPSSLALFGIGLVSSLFIRRRNKHTIIANLK